MKDETEIPKEWSFKNESVAENFDDHVREQLPWYDIITRMVVHCARHYIPEDGRVYDLGCSTGNIGIALAEIIKDRGVDFIAIDNSDEMADRYQGGGTFHCADVADFEFEKFDFAVAFLCLMFITPEKRNALMTRMKGCIKQGGAVLIVDKCAPTSGYEASVMMRLALNEKLLAGAEPIEILKKELSLAGVQRPLSKYEVDFVIQGVEIFRFGDFAGWIVSSQR